MEIKESVKKTEDSLSRLKKMRKGASGHDEPSGMTDEDKIRVQLDIDLDAILLRIRSFGLSEAVLARVQAAVVAVNLDADHTNK